MLHQLLCHLLTSFDITTGHDNSSSRCCQDSGCLGANTCRSSRSHYLDNASLTHLSGSDWEAHGNLRTTVHCIIIMWHIATAMPNATHDCDDELACCLYTVKVCLALCQELLHWGEGDIIYFCMANVCMQAVLSTCRAGMLTCEQSLGRHELC